MKNRTLFIIGIVLMALSSCNNKCKNVPCQIIVYDEASTTKAYLISYNGKDSIETICGGLLSILLEDYTIIKKSTLRIFHLEKFIFTNLKR